MKKIFAVLVLIVCSFSCTAFADVEPDIELHKVIGGLYSLSAAVELNNKTNPNINQLKNYFENPTQVWLNSVKISKTKNSIWVGIALDKTSSARHYLRSNAPELEITNEPEGYAWIGGDFAWLKAADIVKNKLKPIKIFASEGDGTIFFSTENQETWWQANPDFNSRAVREILRKHGTSSYIELERPTQNSRTSIYDDVKPNKVIKVPDKIHVGSRKNSFDMSVEVGDVIFNPIPYHGN